MVYGTQPLAGDIDLDRHRFPVDEWALVEQQYDTADLGVTETLFAVGNGYLGMRGNCEEGRDSYAQGTFINGFHETFDIRHAEEAFGFAKVGQTILNVPDTKTIRLYVDDEPLLLSVADLVSYERRLDFREGVLTRDIVWRTPSGKRVTIKNERLVSFVDRHLAVMRLTVCVEDADAPVVISGQVLNRQDGEDEYRVSAAALGEGFDPRQARKFDHRVLEPQEHEEHDGRVIMSYQVRNSGMTIGLAVDQAIETECPVRTFTNISADRAEQTYRVQAQAGKPITVTKVVAYHTSRGVPTRELLSRCRRTLDRIAETGIESVFEGQRAWLADFWSRSDVVVGGKPEIQQAIRWNLFQVAQAGARAEGTGIPAKGLTGSGYDGHYFWDQEIYVLPFFIYTNPRVARNVLRFRHLMLDAARRRARELNQDGALFPWRTINGEEASAYYAAGTAQYHIDADVSYALIQYLKATGDGEFLTTVAIDILVETARMWADLGFWRSNGNDVFNIHGVTGPDEYTTVVDNNLYTNVMARHNLWWAVRAVRELGERDPEAYERAVLRLRIQPEELDEWQRAADRMAVPFDETLGIHPQDDHFLEREVWDLAQTPPEHRPLLLHYHPLVIYRFQVIKQADVVLALVLQGNHFSDEDKLANFKYYDPLTTGDSTLSSVAQCIIAAEVGYQDLAMEYFLKGLYVDLADLHGNASDGVHVASAGGIWGAVINGFAGMRDHDGILSFDPRLPADWGHLGFSLVWRGMQLDFLLRRDSLQITADAGGSACEITVRGQQIAIEPGTTITVALDGQGPVLEGRPSAADLTGYRRPDGSVITASIPTITADHEEGETPEPAAD